MNEVATHIPIPNLPGKLYLGSVTSINYIIPLNISYVISLFPLLQDMTIPPNVEHDLYSLYDSSDAETVKKMNLILNETSSKIFQRLKEGKNVLVHCFAGISRSSTVVIDFLCSFILYNSVDEVIEILRMYRPQVNPNNGFTNLLRARHK